MDCDNDERSNRMKAFKKAMDKAILASHESINCKELVEECYGKDASIFTDNGDSTIDFSSFMQQSNTTNADSNNDMLTTLVQSTIEKLNDRLNKDIQSLLRKEGVDDLFLKLEYILNELNRENREKLQKDELDKKVTIKAVKMVSSLPTNPEDLVKHQAYAAKMEERDKLLAEISALEQENDDMMSQVDTINSSLRNEMPSLKDMEEEFSKVADFCTSNGLGE